MMAMRPLLYMTTPPLISLFWKGSNYSPDLGPCGFVNSKVSREFIVANSIKRHISDLKSLRLDHDLPTSVNGIAISRRFYFRENKTLAKISEFNRFLRLKIFFSRDKNTSGSSLVSKIHQNQHYILK